MNQVRGGRGAGVAICLGWSADLHMVKPTPLNMYCIGLIIIVISLDHTFKEPIPKTRMLNDKEFIIRTLYKDLY